MGYHMYILYDHDDELMRSLSPFFMEGLRRREHCVWIPRQGIMAHQAINMLKFRIPDIEDFLLTDQMYIGQYEEWYLDEKGNFCRECALAKWRERYDYATQAGYPMMRAVGDSHEVSEKDWQEVIEYERMINESIADLNIIALCAYNGRYLKPTQIRGLLSHHLCSFASSGETV